MKEHPILFSTEMVKAIQEHRKNQTRRVITPRNSVIGEGSVDWRDFCWDGSEILEGDSAPLPYVDDSFGLNYLHVPYKWSEQGTIYRIYPRYHVGDRLWVRETFKAFRKDSMEEAKAKSKLINNIKTIEDMKKFASLPYGHGDISVLYAADYGEWAFDIDSDLKPWKPSIHMPRWASRITLEITGIRAERVQDITEQDAIAEGIQEWEYMFKLYDNPFAGWTRDPILSFKTLWDSINAKRGYGWNINPLNWVYDFKEVKG